MESKKLVLSLLFLVVIASGCSSNGGGSETTSEGDGSITVHRLEVQPTEIYEGKTVGVSMDIINSGQLPAKFNPGKKGERVLKDHCRDIFENTADGYQESTPAEDKGGYYLLKPKQEIKLRWQLEQQGRVPLYGHECDLDFQVPFNYTVRAYKQVQIKEDRSVEASSLNSESSAGPLFLAIETIGSTAEEGQSTFIASEPGEDKNMQILLQLQNAEAEDYGKGVVDIAESTMNIQASPPLTLDEGFKYYPSPGAACGGNPWCFLAYGHSGGYEWENFAGVGDPKCDLDNDDPIRIFEGKSRVITCDLEVPERSALGGSPSMISEISAGVNYTYIKDAGTRNVQVKYSEN